MKQAEYAIKHMYLHNLIVICTKVINFKKKQKTGKGWIHGECPMLINFFYFFQLSYYKMTNRQQILPFSMLLKLEYKKTLKYIFYTHTSVHKTVQSVS